VSCNRFPHAARHFRFWTLLAGAGNNKDQILPTIVDLARAKLICHHKISIRHEDLKRPAVTALLDVLLSLDFEPGRLKAHNREVELIADHMRIVFSVPEHREYLLSGYPSEPLLAEAAARQMEQFQMLSWDPDVNVMAEMLSWEFNGALLDQGQRSEVVFRLLLSSAYRRAVQSDHPDDSEHNFSKGCKLTTFISELFSPDYANQILQSVPDNVKSSTTFATAFQDAVVRFTHFGKMADDTGTNTWGMFAAFVRCMAIICCSSENGVDLLIPVLLEREKMLDEAVMTGLLIQVKPKGSLPRYEIHQEALDFFPAGPSSMGDKRPYITLVAEIRPQLTVTAAMAMTKGRNILARPPWIPLVLPSKTSTKATAGEMPATSVTVTPSTASKPHVPVQPDHEGHPRDTHPRHSIFAYGCSDTVYNVISQSDKSAYKSLLANRDMLDQWHPRKDSESLSAVRSMKPFWSAGVECYQWAEDDFLHKQIRNDDNERLVVGKYEDDTISETD
jgi:hypothetical protein